MYQVERSLNKRGESRLRVRQCYILLGRGVFLDVEVRILRSEGRELRCWKQYRARFVAQVYLFICFT